MSSLLSKVLQYFRSITETARPLELSLSEFFEAVATGSVGQLNFRERIERIRSSSKKEEVSKLKKRLPALLISATTKASTKSTDLIEHTGVLQVDLDKQDNPVLLKDSVSKEWIKQTLMEDDLMMMVADSPSGTGVKLLIHAPHATLENHNTIYQQVLDYLMEKYNLVGDPSCRNINRMMFFTYDPFVHIDESPRAFEGFELQKSNKSIQVNEEVDEIDDPKIKTAIELIEKGSIDITRGYGNWLRLCFFFSSYGERGRSYFHQISRFNPSYDPKITDKQFDACLSSNKSLIGMGSLFYLMEENGIDTSSLTRSEVSRKAYSEGNVYEYLSETPTFPERVYDLLPSRINGLLCTIDSPRAKDVSLLSILTIFSVLMPRIQGRYDSRDFFPNLFTLIVAPPASDKGLMSTLKKLVKFIAKYDGKVGNESENEEDTSQITDLEMDNSSQEGDENDSKVDYNLEVPVNVTYPALIKRIASLPNGILMHETEIDVMNYMLNTDHGNYSALLRKAFQHEDISFLRKKDDEYYNIYDPKLSVLLSGTPGQFKNLIQGVENGLFSRFLYYIYADQSAFRDPFESANDQKSSEINKLAKEAFHVWENWYLESEGTVTFQLTKSQKSRMFNVFSEWEKSSNDIHEGYGKAIIRRLGVSFFRLCMVLSIIRNAEVREDVFCVDHDFDVALMIIKTLMSHTTKAIGLLPDIEVVKVKDIDKNKFFDVLPSGWMPSEAISEGEKYGIVKRTVQRYQSSWMKEGKVRKIDGRYVKLKREEHGK